MSRSTKKGPFVASIGRDHTVLEAAKEMNARRIGALVVTGPGPFSVDARLRR